MDDKPEPKTYFYDWLLVVVLSVVVGGFVISIFPTASIIIAPAIALISVYTIFSNIGEFVEDYTDYQSEQHTDATTNASD